MDLPAGMGMATPPFPSEQSRSAGLPGCDPELAPHLEEKLSEVHDKLVDCVMEQRRKLEQTLQRQQQMLDVCFRHLGIPLPNGAEVTPTLHKKRSPSCPLPGKQPVDTGTPCKSEPVGPPRAISVAQSEGNRRFAWATRSDTTTSILDRASFNAKTMKFTQGMSTLVNHRHFDNVVGAILLLNALFVCMQADFTARNPGSEDPVEYKVIESLFFFVILLELSLRILVSGKKFFVGLEWRWNWFDIIVVVTAAIEEIFKMISTGNHTNLTFLRVMRIIKITRICRIIRVVKLFRELRIMVTSIISTIRTLFWSIVCLFMVMSGVGVYLAIAVSDYQAENGLNSEMLVYFGTLPCTIISLFQATTGGIDWIILFDVLEKVSVIPPIVLLAYVSLMVYAVMNILTGICVTAANRSAEEDMEISLHEELTKHNSAISNLQRIFHEHGDGSGTITVSKLTRHLRNSKVRGYFKKLDLEPWHLHRFFDMLQADGEEPSIDINKFMRGVLRLRCSVKNIDLMTAVHEETRLNEQHYQDFHRTVAGMLGEESARNTKRFMQLQSSINQILANSTRISPENVMQRTDSPSSSVT